MSMGSGATSNSYVDYERAGCVSEGSSALFHDNVAYLLGVA